MWFMYILKNKDGTWLVIQIVDIMALLRSVIIQHGVIYNVKYTVCLEAKSNILLSCINILKIGYML